MVDVYRQFDKDSLGGESDVSRITFKGLYLRKREVALGAAVVACVVVIIILAALLATSKPQKQKTVIVTLAGQCVDNNNTSCFTPACLQTAAHVMELVNTTAAHPCDDFYTFACSNFPRLHPMSPDEDEVSTFKLMTDQTFENIRRLMSQTPISRHPDNFEVKAKIFYESCQDHFYRMKKQGRPFLEQIVAPSGGWWALQGDAAWARHTYNFQSQLEKVHVDFWTNAFFTFHVNPDWLNWNNATIEIDLGGLGIHVAYYTEPMLRVYLGYYKKYMRTVGGLLLRDAALNLTDSERAHRLNTFVEDAFFVQSELAKIKLHAASEPDPHSLEKRLKLSTLNSVSGGALDWVSLFQYMFDSSLVTADTYVVVYEQEYVLQFTAWINNLPASNKSRILNNYMIWRLAAVYEEDLSWDYLQAQQVLYADFLGIKDYVPTWRYCLSLMANSMYEALSAMYVREHFSDLNRQTAHNITDYVKMALVDGLTSHFDWMSPSTREAAKQKIHDSLIKLGYPDYMMDETTLNQIYSVLTFNRYDYFGNLLNFNKLYKKQWNDYLQHPNDRQVWVYATYNHIVEYYNPWKELIVPAGLLQFPIYDHSSPRYSNFGSMGTLVATQLTRAVDEIGNSYRLDGSQFGSWWSVNTTKHYEKVRDCIIDAYKGISNGPFDTVSGQTFTLPINMTYYAPLALSQATGVKLAYKGYKHWVHVTGGENSMPGGRFTNDQMFFISYAQTYCTQRTQMAQINKVESGRSLAENIRINAALSHVKEFQQTFNCPSGSKMVAPKQCSLY